jgi:hypothetical protein
VVTQETAKYTKQCVKSLLSAGFDGVQLFAPRGVALSDSDKVIRHRCAANATETDLFVAAMTCDEKSLYRDVDFLLFISANMEVWGSIKLLMENTIEKNFVGAYFPYAPAPFFLGTESHIPCQGFGWCEVQVSEPIAGAGVVAVNKHTASLLSTQSKRLAEYRVEQSHIWNVGLSAMLRDYEIPAFVHSKSLAWRIGNSVEMEGSVSQSSRLNPRFTERNWYLN